jgi:acyl CoA:acetate/3-ketoacid CoA transferase alpha subunit/acyl CoA:acetate/3-ketoacid CoA transferase beta subunit
MKPHSTRMNAQELNAFIDSKFQIPIVEGEDKLCSVEEAIRRHIRKGMTIHFAGRGGVLFYQLVREFWGKNPGFTIINNVASTVLSLIQGKMVKKFIASFAGDGYPSSGPNPVIQKAYLSGEVEFENWTMLTVVQRLRAGAMGWGFTPTRSIIGSSMEQENKDSFKVISNPFNPKEKIGLMKELRPDIALIHAIAADRCGNLIQTYPLVPDVFGAWGAKNGVIVSAEKIVPTEYIRKYSHLVRIPSYMVKAVCEVPYGAHPGGTTNCGLPEFEDYFDDYDFVTDVRDASRDQEKFERWIKYWILDCKDHNEYLAKVGRDRLLYLKGKACSDSWKTETMAEIPKMNFDRQLNRSETAVITAAHVIFDKFIAGGYKTILTGLGLSNLATWLATNSLKEKGHEVDLMAEIGMYGYLPRASDPTIFSHHNMQTCKILNNIETMLSVFVGGPTNQCMGVLAAGQVDKFGNANSTKIPGVTYLVGSGGANDIATNNRETIVVITSGKSRLMEKVPYITFPGEKVKTLVTDVGVFEKIGDEETFTLTSYVPSKAKEKVEDRIAEIRQKVGWELEITPNLKKAEPATEEEITLLRLFDPRGFFTGP